MAGYTVTGRLGDGGCGVGVGCSGSCGAGGDGGGGEVGGRDGGGVVGAGVGVFGTGGADGFVVGPVVLVIVAVELAVVGLAAQAAVTMASGTSMADAAILRDIALTP